MGQTPPPWKKARSAPAIYDEVCEIANLRWGLWNRKFRLWFSLKELTTISPCLDEICDFANFVVNKIIICDSVVNVVVSIRDEIRALERCPFKAIPHAGGVVQSSAGRSSSIAQHYRRAYTCNPFTLSHRSQSHLMLIIMIIIDFRFIDW